MNARARRSTPRARLLASSIAIALCSLTAGCYRSRNPGGIACVPGQQLMVACSSACGLGSCSGDPVLRVCDGALDSRACAEGSLVLGENDDACGTLCPSAMVTCPASGRITVVHRAYGGGGGPYVCDWSARSSPAGVPLVAGDAGL